MSKEEALAAAEERELDLVLINDKQDPVVRTSLRWLSFTPILELTDTQNWHRINLYNGFILSSSVRFPFSTKLQMQTVSSCDPTVSVILAKKDEY